ncbi:hypothetical protein JOS77_23480 [Chromobacterium haemolyticum]|uniref:hypothetical protein n=1 Tax=Chromobacterium haemolyticum TaxID=394935 RepID=UPI0015C4E4B9|nr:hypothetical protein [Chromobacterium haemolyticum]UGA37076.1 hypothetical protein JOS77_23480 [Chromobacterium haemolyticum]
MLKLLIFMEWVGGAWPDSACAGLACAKTGSGLAGENNAVIQYLSAVFSSAGAMFPP